METRADAWYSGLTESQQWQLYAIAKRGPRRVLAALGGFELFAGEGELVVGGLLAGGLELEFGVALHPVFD